MDGERILHSAAQYARATVPVGVAAGLSAALRDVVEVSDIAMAFLVAIVAAATVLGRGPAIFASVLAVAVFDFLFVPPFLTFKVDELRYLVTFAVMICAGLVTSSLIDRLRKQTADAHAREHQTAALYALTRALAGARDAAAIAVVADAELRRVLGCRAILFVPDASAAAGTRCLDGETGPLPLDEAALDAVHWALWHGRPAGAGQDQLSDAPVLAQPLGEPDRILGVLAVVPAPSESQHQLLDGLVAQIALALERATLTAAAEKARLHAETEEMRSSILSAVSHDLRTPIGSVLGAATTLLDESGSLTREQREELTETIRDEATRLARLVANLLDMSRVESPGFEIDKEWVPVEELVGAVLSRLEPRLEGRDITLRVSPSALAQVDPVLLDVVLSNLLENVLKHTPDGSPIRIEAHSTRHGVQLEVADRGPGIRSGSETRIFEKFARESPAAGGVGLGLAICRGIVRAHGGTIVAAHREGGGARFVIDIPHTDEPPDLLVEATG